MNQPHRPQFIFLTVAARMTDPPAIPIAMVSDNTNVWSFFLAHLPMNTGTTTASKIVFVTMIVANWTLILQKTKCSAVAKAKRQ